LLREPDAGDAHHDVANISFLEDNATRDGRNPDPVAVITNPGDDPPEEILRVFRSLRELVQRIIQGPEVQRIGERDRLRPHREDVTQDAANTGVGPSVRLDRGRMVVTPNA